MRFKATPQQAFLLFSMLFGETPDECEPKKGSVMKGRARDRDALKEVGLVRYEKRVRTTGTRTSRAEHLVLNDAAWDWAVENLNVALPKTQAAAVVLQRVLARLAHFLAHSDHTLAEFVHATGRSQEKRGGLDRHGPDLNQQVRQACLELTRGKTKQRVRLKDLRRHLSVSRQALDETLLSMQQAGALVLMRLDNPAEITPDDDAAALRIAGNPRHLVYLEG